MAIFIDSEKREWNIKLTLGSVMRVKRDAGIDFGIINQNGGNVKLSQMLSDMPTLAMVCYVLACEQIANAGLTYEQFAEAIDGDCLESMGAAITDEMINFSPPHRREVMKAGLSRAKKLMQTSQAKAIQAIENVSDEAIIKQLSNGGSMPTGSADTPEPIQTSEH